jgi:broad specificity phosphatase PhoE
MFRLVLICPGSTELDDQGRIKGSLDIPLSENGSSQVARAVGELADTTIEHIYTSPAKSAKQTAEAIAARRDLKVKTVDKLQNLDHGLWQGKLINEVRQNQPKIYKKWQDKPETVCPPGGETLESAQGRVKAALTKLAKKHKSGTVALVVPEPLASLVRCCVNSSELGDLWKSECDCGTWELINVEPARIGASG